MTRVRIGQPGYRCVWDVADGDLVEFDASGCPSSTIIDGVDGGADPLVSAAEAATVASRDAETAAESAAETVIAARAAALASAEVAAHARVATATAVAAAAASTATLAAQTAAAVEAEAVARADDVAMSAVAARDTIAFELPVGADPDDARQAADAVAATVAADVLARETATAQAAALVADAVTTAARAVFLAAQSAAATVEVAATTAAASGRAVAVSSAQTQAATGVVVGATARVADFGAQLREVAALRGLDPARNPPLVAELTAALARGELRLHYQPMYGMETGALVAVEALLRWQHPTRGLLPPADFLDVVESHPDLVTPIGDWVLATAIAQSKRWRGTHVVHSPRMWVNISCNQLGQHHLPGVVEALLLEAGLAPASLGLEVTERQLIRKADDAASDLAALRDLGVALAVDDFGTGYASLDYLRKFAFDEIKIDRSFISGLGRDKTDTAVTSSIIELGRSLDLTVVAEGVETQEQYDHLKRLGCPVSQGYLLHRPAPPERIGRLLGGDAALTDATGLRLVHGPS